MCGIAGIINLSKEPIRKSELVPLCQEMERRGPDANGVWIDKNIGLTHTRLAIMDLDPRSNQPFIDEKQVLVYNGEIFNFREIRKELEDLGHHFKTSGDTEVLFFALQQWGVEKAIEKLAGMFAFAVHDCKSGETTIVRDRLGIKPCYYALLGEKLIFASWPSAILATRKSGWSIDEESVHALFSLGAVYGGGTLVKEVRELEAGHLMKIKGSKVKTKAWYSCPPTTPKRFDREEFEELFDHIVGQHAEADVPSAHFLSGGVDSSCLAMAMPGMDCFHMRSDEEAYARSVAEAVGSKFVVSEIGTGDNSDQLLESMASITGAAFGSAIQPMLISDAIAKAGFKVAFSANGADELFLGYFRTPAFTNDRGGEFLFPFERESTKSFAEQYRHMQRSPENLVEKGSNKPWQQAGLERLINEEATLVESGVAPNAIYRWFELKRYVMQELNPALDHASMVNSIEVRVPFLDHRLVEYALSLPEEDLITAHYGRKTPLKAYLEDKGLHESAWQRQKLGFALSHDDALKVRDRQLNAYERLKKLELVNFAPRTGNVYRDFSYVMSAAHSFDIWYSTWVDTGVVSHA